jgi:hypothetical protein
MDLRNPSHIWSRKQVLTKPSPVPREPGFYAWYFKEVPPGVPTQDCIVVDGLTLLYVGIAPRPVPRNGKPPSKQRLWNRIRYHYRGNAEGSTLRLTLGCLLEDRLTIQLRRVGSGSRFTFGAGESTLSQWMDENALVAWQVDAEPWRLEHQAIATISLPLNLDMNKAHAYCSGLALIRKRARDRAKDSPVVA